MGTGWRRAFCTTIPRDGDATISEKQQPSPSPSPSPKSSTKLGFFSSGGSNPSTPRFQSQPVSNPSLRCRTTVTNAQTSAVQDSPTLQCKTASTKTTKNPLQLLGSNPSSPRSPLKLSLFRNSFRLRNSCGICLQSVKTGQGMAIYTAECSHAFHFPCIASHVRKQGTLVCPVCNAAWKDVPLLAIHKNLQPETQDDVQAAENRPKVEEKKIESPSPRLIRQVSDVRAYDDDEPLLSPTAGEKFISIPEADENEEGEEENDETQEFQGFFVNPTRSCSIKSGDDNGKDVRNIEVKLMPEAAVVSVGRSHEAYAVVLRVKAPPIPPPTAAQNHISSIPNASRRAPIDLVTVLDVSGSMTGSKLQMLKRAMRLVISSLGSADRLSIVAFSASPKRLLPLRRMTSTGQRSARRIIDRLVCGQGNSMGDALRKATKVLEDRRERNPVASIMLLSDGQDERVQNSSSHQRQESTHSAASTRFAHVEIPVHTFGYGQNGGYSQEPAGDAFAKCVGGLLSVVVQDLRIQLGFASGSAPAEISAVYSCNGRPTVLGSSIIRLGDLYAEEDRELLIELRVPSSYVGGHHALSVRCSYKDPATQELVYGREQALLVPRPHAVRSSAPNIERLKNIFITTRAIAESRRLVEHNDFSSAHHLLASARALLMQANSVLAEEYVNSLEAELVELTWRRQHVLQMQQEHGMMQRRRTGEREMAMADENGEPLTPTSAWRAAEKLAKVAIMKKSLNRVSDLHGFENARF